MDPDAELAKFKWLLFSAATFLVSGCISWGELSYAVSGRDAQADVVKAYEVTRGGKFGVGGRRRLTVDYAFTEPDGTRRTGTATASPDFPARPGGKVAVRYLPGADNDSRLSGHVNWVGVALFGLSLTLIGVFGFKLWREAADETGGRKKPKRGR